MTTAVQPTIPNIELSAYQIAARKIPGFARNSIKGDGPFAIKILCPTHRGLLLFETHSKRDHAMHRLDLLDDACEGRHFRIDLDAE